MLFKLSIKSTVLAYLESRKCSSEHAIRFAEEKAYGTTQVIRGRARANKDKNNAPESESQWLNSSTCQSMNWIGKEHRHESFLSSATQRSLENSLLDVNSTGRVEKKAKKTEEKKLIVLSKKWRLIGVERQKAKQSRPKQQSRAGDGAPRVSERNRRERKRRRPPFFHPFFFFFFFSINPLGKHGLNLICMGVLRPCSRCRPWWVPLIASSILVLCFIQARADETQQLLGDLELEVNPADIVAQIERLGHLSDTTPPSITRILYSKNDVR